VSDKDDLIFQLAHTSPGHITAIETLRERACKIVARVGDTSLSITHVPLAPFDSPHPPRCQAWVVGEEDSYDDDDKVRCYEKEDHPVHAAWTTPDSQLALEERKRHDFDPFPYVQRKAGSKDDRIDPDKTYLAKIHGAWYLGGFDEQWYGWNFDGWVNAAGYQLDCIEDLYEVDLGPLG
jgi:hypothetical protein